MIFFLFPFFKGLSIQDPTFHGLITRYNELKLERERALRTTPPNNPLVQNMNDRLTNLRENILKNLTSIKSSLMSVVGPRPYMPKHTQDYSVLIGNFIVRHFLTSSITGWAKVNGFRGETKETTAMRKRVEADVWYLENRTLLLEIKIIILTVWHMFRGNVNAFR